ncbi:MAG: response regulator transcription factor [Clostridia bacterium]|nr:response regulator transcription factor [Clostridia bacterium]MDO5327343.1 response regulator transcription factor [Clostridia bacterium]
MRILLVEDEKGISSAICQVLKKENFSVDPVYTGPDGLDWALAGIYDAIILDVMLPGMDGFQVLQRLRKEGVKTPVCMLTARSGLEDRVHGLESGADYYLPKPFQMAELTACLRAITRRREDAPVMELAFGDIQLNQQEAKLLCTATGQSVKLGAKEYQIMEMFLRNPRQILAKDMIFDRVWGYESEADMSNLEVYLSFVRKKLTFVGSKVKIKASRGIGYSLEEEA